MIRHLLVAAITIGVLSGLRVFFERRAPKSFDGVEARIGPGKGLAITVIAGGAGLAALGLAVADGWVGIAMALMGAAIIFFMLPSLTNWHDVIWNAQGIEGPCKLFGLTLGRARTTIQWHEIERIGSTSTGYDYVEAAGQRRIYWASYYAGYGWLLEALDKHIVTDDERSRH